MRFFRWLMLWIDGLFGNHPDTFDEPVVKERKKHDTSKLTRQDYDAIMEEYELYQECKKIRGKEFKSTLHDVTCKLNARLGYNKSTNSYAPIWRGTVSRDSLGERIGV